ncbi:MAG: hypothetical protein RJB11_3025 [Planctomycetota bacterium]
MRNTLPIRNDFAETSLVNVFFKVFCMGLVKQPPPCVRFAAAFSSSREALGRIWERLQEVWGPIARLGLPFDFVESEYYLATMCPLTHDAPANAATKAAANVAPNTAFGAAVEMPNSSVESRMEGRGLFKQLAIFESFYDPACLADDKLKSNLWEEQWGQEWLNQGLFSQTPLSQTPLSKGFDVSEGTKGDTPDRTIQRPINIDPGYISMTKLVLASTKNREHRLYLRDGIYAEVTLAFRDQRWQPMGWTYADYQRDDVLEFLTQGRQWFTKQVASHRHRADLVPMHDKPADNNAGPNPINGA